MLHLRYNKIGCIWFTTTQTYFISNIISTTETKCVNEGRLKLNGFRVFEHVRTNQDGGGGRAIGCSIKLSPVLPRSGGDQAEALTVNIKLQK